MVVKRDFIIRKSKVAVYMAKIRVSMSIHSTELASHFFASNGSLTHGGTTSDFLIFKILATNWSLLLNVLKPMKMVQYFMFKIIKAMYTMIPVTSTIFIMSPKVPCFASAISLYSVMKNRYI